MTPDQLEEATRRFLDKYPKVAASIAVKSANEARVHEVSEEEVRAVLLQKAIEQQARMLSLDTYRYLVRLAVDTPEERRQLLDAYDTAAARELGLSLEEYRQPVSAGSE